MTQKASVTAAVLVIGDEILSGRTKDANSGYIADYLAKIGIDLREMRVVGDVADEIVDAVNALRRAMIMSSPPAASARRMTTSPPTRWRRLSAFRISEDPRAIKLLLERMKPEHLNEARRRMARIPQGAELVENDISKAPGFWIGNVIVMAGVPAIMQSMLDRVAPKLATGAKVVARTIEAGNLFEGVYAAGLGELAAQNPELSIGSYPSYRDGAFHNQIVVRGKDPAKVADAAAAIEALLSRLVNERV